MTLRNMRIEKGDGVRAIICPECGQEVDSIIVPYVEHQLEDSLLLSKTPIQLGSCAPCLKRLGLEPVIRAGD